MKRQIVVSKVAFVFLMCEKIKLEIKTSTVSILYA